MLKKILEETCPEDILTSYHPIIVMLKSQDECIVNFALNSLAEAEGICVSSFPSLIVSLDPELLLEELNERGLDDVKRLVFSESRELSSLALEVLRVSGYIEELFNEENPGSQAPWPIQDEQYCDITFRAGTDTLRAHRFIVAKIPMLREMMTQGVSDITLTCDKYTPQGFVAMLEFAYTSDIAAFTPQIAAAVIACANAFGYSALEKWATGTMLNMLMDMTSEQTNEMLSAAKNNWFGLFPQPTVTFSLHPHPLLSLLSLSSPPSLSLLSPFSPLLSPPLFCPETNLCYLIGSRR